MTKENFQKIIGDTLKQFPQRFLNKLENVAIVVQDYPTDFQLRKLGYRKGNCILGLYEGIPQGKRRNYDKALPDKITIFKKNIEQIAKSDLEIKNIIEETVWHEIGHHFGMTEEEVRKATIERRKRKSFFIKRDN